MEYEQEFNSDHFVIPSMGLPICFLAVLVTDKDPWTPKILLKTKMDKKHACKHA